MRKEEYEFTGYYPSGNSCKWLYDKNKQTLFSTDTETRWWDKEPKIGDKITIVKDPNNYRLIEAFINGQSVYKWDAEKQKKEDEKMEQEREAELLFHKKRLGII